MKKKPISHILALLCAGGCLASPAAHASSERESLETLRQTTLNLIDVLVSQGVMNRDQANALVKAAEQKAAATVAEQQRQTAQAGGQVVTTGDKGRLRVSFIPDSVKNEIREQIRQEVLAQAKQEKWAAPNAIPEWTERIIWEGDIRVRSQSDMMARDNAAALAYRNVETSNTVGAMTRAADFGVANNLTNPSAGTASAYTLDDRERLRVRARLGMRAIVNEQVQAGFRIVTGSATDRVSTNQTLGNNFNKYSVFLDRAYLTYEPTSWASITGGRIANPWFSTDLVWDENLNFEGVAATFRERQQRMTFKPFATVGYFPIRADNPPRADNRWLSGVQGGFEWDVNSNTRFKLGAAYYSYKNIEARQETNTAFLTGADYGQYEYEAGLRQKGNTLFRTNATLDCAAGFKCNSTIWGLASQYKPFNLTAVLDLAHLDPLHVTLVADYVKNLGFDRNEIMARTGLSADSVAGMKDSGAMLKLQIGHPVISNVHDWNASIAYRRLGSDAVLDAFTVADFGLGGTNMKGYALGLNYGLERNTVLGVRWLSADAIQSMLPTGNARYGVDILQLDLSARF